MKQGHTDITLILDRSGSMEAVRTDTIGGVNTFLAEQKKEPGEATVSLYQFDDIYEAVYEGRPLREAPDLSIETYVPRNYTALYDAICYTINNVGSRLGSMKEEDRPEKVLIVIITDGMNNASKEFTAREVNAMISHQREYYKWEFQFIGANQDAIAGGASIGVPMQNSLSYAANSAGTGKMFGSLSKRVSAYRMAAPGAVAAASLEFTEEDRKLQEEAGVKNDQEKLREWLSGSHRPNLPK